VRPPSLFSSAGWCSPVRESGLAAGVSGWVIVSAVGSRFQTVVDLDAMGADGPGLAGPLLAGSSGRERVGAERNSRVSGVPGCLLAGHRAKAVTESPAGSPKAGSGS